MYNDKLDEMINEYDNTYHRTIKRKPINVDSSIYIYFSVEYDNKNPKFEVQNRIKIPKYENICAKNSNTNFSEEVYIIKTFLCYGHS